MFLEWTVRKKYFRTVHHALWFLTSIYLFLFTLAYYFWPGRSAVILLPLIVHFIAMVQAIHVHKSKQDSETLSVDCIWWNALMTGAYVVIYFTIN